jgi:thiol-disulfide isomerase/thioredoxin
VSRAVSQTNDRRKYIIWAIVAIVVIAAVVLLKWALSSNVVPENATKAVGQSTIKVGDTAPEFTVQTNAGPFDLNSVSVPVLLEVFATWCPHCQRETTVMNQVATQYAGKVAVVAVSGDAFNMNHDGPESQADVNTFAQQFAVRYPIAFDPQLKVAQAYLKEGFPTIVLIGADKKIRWITSGETKRADIDKAISGALSGST